MTDMIFTVQFHQPFLVRSGTSRGGMDAVARPGRPLPASSLKGAMRAACTHVLGVDSALTEAIFGREGRTGGAMGLGAWAWTDAGPGSVFTVQRRPRNRIDPDAAVAMPEALTVSEEWWQLDRQAEFTIEQITRLTPENLERHQVVLQSAAHAVTALGSWRNRGMGTVTIRPRVRLDRLAQRLEQVIA